LSQCTNYMSVSPKATIVRLLCNIYRHHALILALALRDLQSRYAGTLGGVLWTFAHPLAVVSIFYFVFAIGFKSQGPDSTPFILWFVCGLVPWFFFNDTLLAATDSITRHAHLVKKTVFPSEILPFVNLTSGLVPHAIFLLIVVGMLAFFNVPFLANRFLAVYFLICACVFLLGLGWMLSALQVFYRDISHALSIILNLWFWATPIVWTPDIMPAEYRGLLFYNPMYYIIEGYRGLLIFNTAVWPSAWHTAYFWGIAALTFVVGAYVFGRLKPEFVDVM
jgi:ABC-type polysaccharide/polyol phosphate export permease